MKIVKGLTGCIIVAFISFILGNLLPVFGTDTFAILLGIVVGNTLMKGDEYQPGIKFAEKTILSIAIALLGISLNLKALIHVGIKGVLLILILMTFVLVINYFLGKFLGFSERFSILMGVGNAVCGSSAIAAVAPVINAHEDEAGIPVAVINLVGTVFMFLLPFMAVHLLNYNTIQAGALIGGGLQSVGQVVVAGAFLNINVAKMAILFKMVRVLMIGVLVVILGKLFGGNTENSKSFFIPWFIVVFFLLSIIGSSGFLPTIVVETIKKLSQYLLTVAIVGIGMRVKFTDILKEGPKALLFGFTAALIQIGFLILLINTLLS